MVVKLFVCGNDEAAKDDKTCDNEVEECALVPGELTLVLGYQGTGVSLSLPICSAELWYITSVQRLAFI